MKKIFIYFVVIWGICLIVQYFVDAGLRKLATDDYGVWNRIFQGRINSDIIIQGSSRALVQYNPKIIESVTGLSCFNLGTSGGRFIMQKAKWDSYLISNKSPKIIIQNVDIMTLRKEEYIFNKVQYLPYLSYPSVSSNLEKIDNEIWLEKIVPLYKYRGFYSTVFLGLRSYFNLIPQTKNNFYHGYIAEQKTWNQDFSLFKSTHEEIVHSDIDIKFGLDFLERLMQECRAKGIHLILVHAPVYFELLKMTPQKDLIDSLFINLANKYGMQYWDYSKIPISYNRKYFYNASHLNLLGANLFSRHFARDLNSYIQQKVTFKTLSFNNLTK